MNIIVCDPVDETVIEHFRDHSDYHIEEIFDGQELIDHVAGAHVLVVRSGTTVDRSLLDRAENLVGIVRAGVGLDNIDLEAAEQRDVKVLNTPEASSNAVAELVVAHVLSLFRSIPRADHALKQGDWIKSELTGREIQGKTLGIIGIGRIGERVGQIMESFGAEVVAYDEYLTDDQIRSSGARPMEMKEVLSVADILTVHVPLTEETRHFISSDEIERMKDEAVIVNCARGGVIDEEALRQALDGQRLGGVGLDTFEQEPPGENPLVQHPRVVATPHIGASTSEAQQRIARLVIDKIESLALE